MAIAPLDPLKTISRSQVVRLENLGATVTSTTITATQDQLWTARISPSHRRLLELRGNLAMNVG